MKIIAIIVLFFVSTLAEPPVDNRYLPPQSSRAGFGTPLQTYGPPSAGFKGQQTGAVVRSRPSSNYGSPFNQGSSSRRPSTQYGAPATQNNGPAPYNSYRSSQVNGNVQVDIPSSPSQEYGVPGIANDNSFRSRQSGAYESAQNRQYLPPGRSYAGDDGSNGEPANYNFEYAVLDEASGNDFGHRESRQGDRAEGLYYVLLPDGRKQTVEYEADQDGYKPRISYQDTGLGNDGFGRNQNSGYPSQEGPY